MVHSDKDSKSGSSEDISWVFDSHKSWISVICKARVCAKMSPCVPRLRLEHDMSVSKEKGKTDVQHLTFLALSSSLLKTVPKLGAGLGVSRGLKRSARDCMD